MEEAKQEGIYDASSLGKGKMMVLGFQHMFAMFGATVLVPLITGLPISATLLFAGIGTLIFHLCTKWMVPAFLGSSFAFLGGYASVVEMGGALGYTAPVALTYACVGVACAGIMYFILSALFYFYGVRKTMRFFPPVVTGPIIISIGLILSASAIQRTVILVDCHPGHCNHCGCQRVRQGHDQDHSHSSWRAWLISGSRMCR